MDVSRVDPEEALVDCETVEAGDISVEMDESPLQDYGQEDKVLVSVRSVMYTSYAIAQSNSEQNTTLSLPICMGAYE